MTILVLYHLESNNGIDNQGIKKRDQDGIVSAKNMGNDL